MEIDRRFHVRHCFIVGVGLRHDRAGDAKRVGNIAVCMLLDQDLKMSHRPGYSAAGVACSFRPSARTTFSTVLNSGLPSGDSAL